MPKSYGTLKEAVDETEIEKNEPALSPVRSLEVSSQHDGVYCHGILMSRPRRTGTRDFCPLFEDHSGDAEIDQTSVPDQFVLLDGPRVLFVVLHRLCGRSRVRRRSHGKPDNNRTLTVRHRCTVVNEQHYLTPVRLL